MFAMLNQNGGGVGTSEYGGDGGEASGDVGGGGIHGIICLCR